MQLDILKRRIPKDFYYVSFFIPKGHYSEIFYLKESLFLKVFIPKGHLRILRNYIYKIVKTVTVKKLQNDESSGYKLLD